ncbi:DUF423 domain-containing protein [Montanilutibacter psychrotolerans]|uniref:DUF423 domain-containing protein n=1 Tax=Montanilutibacter psychrotolerans TaxID=1327343 RepID=A0A3M8SKC3_9GAMM|nr:DUF423 domain-containing protein [Lysobacter psychrotolerans]RNF81741.1 DUF423 domain-containing protein [Lysobacter psychrotolerans]
MSGSQPPPTPSTPLSSPSVRALAASGAVLAALSVALSAYAAHGAGGEVRAHLQTAALFAFGHGIALAALAPHALRGLARLALAGLLAGVLMFSGSLVATHVFGVSLGLAPFGGSLMILAWLVYAADAARR